MSKSALLLNNFLHFVDMNSTIHIHNRSIDTVCRVKDAREDRDLDGLVVRSVFASAMDYSNIGIELYTNKLSKDEIESYKMEFRDDPTINIEFLIKDLNFEAREIAVRTDSSYLFIGSYKEFINYLECYKDRKVISLKRIHIGEPDRNAIEIIVEEEVPALKVRHILPYLYSRKKVTIMDWDQNLIYRGNADEIYGEILNRYIDKFYVTQIPNNLVVLLKRK